MLLNKDEKPCKHIFEFLAQLVDLVMLNLWVIVRDVLAILGALTAYVGYGRLAGWWP